MKTLAAAFLLGAVALSAETTIDKAEQVDEAFRLAGVRPLLEALPARAGEMTVAVLATFPPDKRKELEPAAKDIARRMLEPSLCYPLVRRYFLQHFDAVQMRSFVALEKTPTYRTMHRQEEQAGLPALQSSRRTFLRNLPNDPPPPARRQLLEKLDEINGYTVLHQGLVMATVNSSLAGLTMTLPEEFESVKTSVSARANPIVQDQTLALLLFTFRNAEDVDIQDYLEASQQPAVIWFNRTLNAAILAAVGERGPISSDYIRVHPPKPFN
jgi:hypothetical protein